MDGYFWLGVIANVVVVSGGILGGVLGVFNKLDTKFTGVYSRIDEIRDSISAKYDTEIKDVHKRIDAIFVRKTGQ